jgi:hypothetical protein
MSAPTPLAAHTPTLAESALALDHAATPRLLAALTLLPADSPHALPDGAVDPLLHAAPPPALAELPLAPCATPSTALTDTPAERPLALLHGAVTPSTDAPDTLYPHPCHALPDTALDATPVRMTSAPTTLSPHSP